MNGKLMALTVAVLMLFAACGGSGANTPADATTAPATTAKQEQTTVAETTQKESKAEETAATTTATQTTAAQTTKKESVAATTTATAAANKANEVAAGEEPLSFSWYINYDWYSAGEWPEPGKLGEEWIKANKNVDIKFMDPGGAASQRLATMIIDNSYPDVICIDRGQDFDRLVAAGALVPLDAYVEGSNLEKTLGKGLINMYRPADGKMYVFPNWALGENFANGNGGYLVQEKYYKALGSPELKTFDDLYDYILLVKEKYPDVLPLHVGEDMNGGAAIYGGMAYGNNPGYYGNRVWAKDGALVSYFEDPSLVETFVFINKLYRERLIPQDIFTMMGEQRREAFRSGKVAVGVMGNICDMTNEFDMLAKEDPESIYVPITPLTKPGLDPKAIYTNSFNRLGWNINVISKDAKNPEAIFKYLDWLFSNEGQLVMVYGPPGDYYDYGDYNEKGFPVKMNQAYYDATDAEIASRWCGSNWVGNTSYVDGMGIHLYNIGAPTGWVKKTQIEYIWCHSANATELSNTQPSFDSDEGMIYQAIDLIYKEAVPEIIVSPSEEACRANIDKYIKELYDNDLQRLLDYQTNVWKQNKLALGY